MRLSSGLFMRILSIAFLFTVLVPVISGADSNRIRPCTDHPRYWEYKGAPVLLIGGSDEDNLFNNPAMMRENLDTLAKLGGNYIRGTLSWRDEGNVPPYAGQGGKYDLDMFNPKFWQRLESCVREGEARSVIVQIEIWATFDFYRDNWLASPFNPANNVNYTVDNTQLTTEWDFHPARNPQPFFHTVPALNNDSVVLRYQEAYVRKVLDTTVKYPNVLYCLDNETRTPAEWALYWGKFIAGEADRRDIGIQLTEMWDNWDITNKDHSMTYRHPELFSFTDISQNNWQEGETHYQRILWFQRTIAGMPGGIRPINNVKVYARRGGGKPNDYDLGVERWWQNIFAGCASTRFHRPDSGSGLDENARRAIRGANVFFSEFDIFESEPRPDLLTSREDNEAFCLASGDGAYAVYFPHGGEVDLEVTGRASRVAWFDPRTVMFMEEPETDIETALRNAPQGGHRLLRLKTPDDRRNQLVLVVCKL